MATAASAINDLDLKEFKPGVLAGVEVSDREDLELTDAEKNEIKMLCEKAAKRDYPARLIEIIAAWEARLFYRGFQFLIPARGGGWEIPGESTGYGPSMQLDLALLPTNIYSTYAQILISTLTRAVPNVRFTPQDPNNDGQITGSESANKFIRVVERNNDLIVIQTDACRYLFTDGRALYYTRFMRDGQRFGWEEEDEPDDIVPETEPTEQAAEAAVENEEAKENEASQDETPVAEREEQETSSEGESDEEEELPVIANRTPRGQEVRTALGKLEVKIVPMQANNLAETDVVQFEEEVDTSRAKGMFPHIADKIMAGQAGITEGEIARLARINVKLGMQSSYVTSDSIAQDTTIQRTWFRPSYLTHITKPEIRTSLMKKCPDGLAVAYAGKEFAYARNQSIEDNWALMQAYSGDGQNRNALGTSLLPIQKRLNNWLDLMNDLFIRCIPKKWMHNKAFNVEAIRGQTNIPGDVGPYKPQQGLTAADLVFVEPAINVPQSLPEFIRQYSGELAELLTGAYPALAGSDQDSNPTATGKVIQRDQALGRIGPTWHQIQNAEADSMLQAVKWAARCRDGSINEFVPGTEAVRLEVNDLRSNIMCYPEADESFPETHAQTRNRLTQFLGDSAKNPMLAEALYNAANIAFLQRMQGMTELYIPQVASLEKQEGEIEVLLKNKPVPNPKIIQAEELIAQLKQNTMVDPTQLTQAEMELQQLTQNKPVVTSIPIDADTEDNGTEAFTCWKYLNSPEGRAAKKNNNEGYTNVKLHFMDHRDAAQANATGGGAAGKPPSLSANYKDVNAVDPSAGAQLLQKAGIQAKPVAQLPAPAPGPAGPQVPPGAPIQ